jgi:uncharacterized protein (DUF4415 family)
MAISRAEQLKILMSMKDEDIDYSDAPASTPEELARMKLYLPPEKKSITVRVDTEVLQWFKDQQPRGYQTLINAVLREYVLSRKEA